MKFITNFFTDDPDVAWEEMRRFHDAPQKPKHGKKKHHNGKSKSPKTPNLPTPFECFFWTLVAVIFVYLIVKR